MAKEKILLYKVRVKKDPDAFAQLYDFYVEPIYRFVYFKLSSKEDAEDITSEVFLKTWNYLITSGNHVNSFRHLVYKIARNRIIDVYRERTNRMECPIETIQNVAVTADLRKIIEIKDEGIQILLVMKKLKSEYQEVIHLKYVEGLSAGDIAEILEKSYTNVRVLLHRAIKKLKELTEAEQNMKHEA